MTKIALYEKNCLTLFHVKLYIPVHVCVPTYVGASVGLSVCLSVCMDVFGFREGWLAVCIHMEKS